MNHLTSLNSSIKSKFPHLETYNPGLIINPFTMNIAEVDHLIQKELIGLQNNSFLETKFKALKLEEFWIQVGYELKIIGKHVLNYLTIFPSTYICELHFHI